MENKSPFQPEPLRIVKAQPLSKLGIGVPFCYPRVPRRDSSLRAVSGTPPSGKSGDLSRTPSPTDGLDQLHIRKIRAEPRAQATHQNQIASAKGNKANTNDLELSRKDNLKMSTASRIIPWLRTVSPKNMMTAIRNVSRGSAASSSGTHARSTSSHSGLSFPSKGRITSVSNRSGACEGNQGSRQMSLDFTGTSSSSSAPRSIPIAAVSLNVVAESPRIRARPHSTWATVDAYVDVDPTDTSDITCPAPLDVVLILDYVPRASTETIIKAIASCLAVISNLDNELDRFAIGYLDKDALGGFRVLLPLSSHSLESAQQAMINFESAQLAKKKAKMPDAMEAMCQAADILGNSERTNFGHIVFITTILGRRLSTPQADGKVGIHTISPDSRFIFGSNAVPLGWHIFFDTKCYDGVTAEDVLQDKVRKVISYLRAGANPGVIMDLKLKLDGQNGSQIQSVWGETEVPALRPGDRWIVPVQISVPAAPRKLSDNNRQSISLRPHPIEKLMCQLYEMLGCFPHGEVTQDIMTASIEFKHSLLGMCSTVRMESACKVIRNLRRCYPVGFSFGLLPLERVVEEREATDDETEDEEDYHDPSEEEQENGEEEGYEGEEEDEGDSVDYEDSEYSEDEEADGEHEDEYEDDGDQRERNEGQYNEDDYAMSIDG